MTGFRLLRQFNTAEGARALGHKGYLDERCARLFPGDDLGSRFVRALARRRAVPFNEVLESFEFFAAVRKDVRAPVVADLCAGHGLVGTLFALYERKVERVQLVDRTPPASRDLVLQAAAEVGPWTADKIEFHDQSLELFADQLPDRASVVSVHACGHRTDRCIDLGVRAGGAIAVMPCCRSKRQSPNSAPVGRALGFDLAIDIDRTYRMEAAGLTVRWVDVAAAITPMNRVLVGRRRRQSHASTATGVSAGRPGTTP